MAIFCVQCFDSNGMPKNNGENYNVEAQSKLEAAEKTCGGPLTQNERPKMYRRANVRTYKNLNESNYFFDPSEY